ncbi:unnamed protein product [Laminaria digitata]
MDTALPPPYNGDADHVVTGGTFHSRILKDEHHYARDVKIPPRGGDGGDDGGDGDADKPASRQTTRARVILAVGLLLEMAATLWAFQQAVSAGVLYGTVDCGEDTLLFRLYSSWLVQEDCDGPVDPEAFNNFTEALAGYDETTSASVFFFQDYTVCDTSSLIDAPTKADGLEERCTCSNQGGLSVSSGCSWIALSSPTDDECYAEPVRLFVNLDGVTEVRPTDVYGICWASNPEGTVALTITALVVALNSQL